MRKLLAICSPTLITCSKNYTGQLAIGHWLVHSRTGTRKCTALFKNLEMHLCAQAKLCTFWMLHVLGHLKCTIASEPEAHKKGTTWAPEAHRVCTRATQVCSLTAHSQNLQLATLCTSSAQVLKTFGIAHSVAMHR